VEVVESDKKFRITEESTVEWVVYEDDEEIHVYPTLDKITLMKPHTMSINCRCSPRTESDGEEYKTVVIHNMLH